MNPAGGASHKAMVMEVLNAALAAADPYEAVLKALDEQPDVRQLLTSLSSNAKIYLVGVGKAGAAMARAAQHVLGERIAGGVVIIKDEGRRTKGEGSRHADDRRPDGLQVQLREAGHPVPDERGVAATSELVKLAGGAGPEDLVLCLISGGGSALLTLPAEGISLQDIQGVTGLLLRAGATINELNAVRKHLSGVSGGQLARIAAPARLLSLILSDVTGSPLDVIASGPTVPDPTTFGDALAILERYGLTPKAPGSVLGRLKRGAAGEIAETPKPGDPLFDNVTNALVASNVTAVEAAAGKARTMGFNTSIISTYLEGEARTVGQVLAGIAHELAKYDRPLALPACLLFGGETTVTVRGHGVGGRNTELALSAAIALDGLGADVLVASLATDGGDGISPSAGAIVDGTTLDRGRALGLDARKSLDNNDSYSYLSALGEAIMTGPTGTNVNDVMAIFAFQHRLPMT